MKYTALLVLLAASLTMFPKPVPASPAEAAPGPRIEVAFVLDTTQSMSGLIEGAKQKIWSIAHRMVSGRPTPGIKLALVGFRDRGDEYVTRTFDLTNDLDAIYGHLMEFQARGGGDTPESVNQALNEAVTKFSWSKDSSTLRIVFLVGDAPPHMDYADDVKYPETLRLANAAGIIVNTIQCGAQAATTPLWKEIAAAGKGEFVRIDQSGGMTLTATPMDEELRRLSTDLTRTVVPYGSALLQREVGMKSVNAGAAAPDRVVFMNLDRADYGAKVVVTGEGELIWDVVNRKVKVEDVPEADLPAQMKSMSIVQRKEFVDEQFTRRKELQIKVDELAAERERYLRTEVRRQVESAHDSFDMEVAAMIQRQARGRGIEYEVIVP